MVTLSTGSYLLSSTGRNRGLVSYRLDAGGVLITIADTQYFTPESSPQIGWDMDASSSGTVVLGGDNGTAHYSISTNSGQVMYHTPNGTIAAQPIFLDGVTALDSIQIGTQNGISSFQINSANGALTPVEDIGADDGLSLHTLLPDGRLIHIDTIAHDTRQSLMNVSQLEMVVIGDLLQIYAAIAPFPGPRAIASICLTSADRRQQLNRRARHRRENRNPNHLERRSDPHP